MKQFSQQLHKKAQATVKLQPEEQRELRERLVSYMEYHPLPAEMKVVSDTVQQKSKIYLPAESFAVFSMPFFTIFKSAAIATAILLLVVPFAAERAVPGDTLYAVKVRFNEELRGSLTFDSYQKVEWETERVNRRIAEARLLASEGRLTEEVEAEVADAVRVHTESAKREIEALRVDDADGATIASIALDTTLEVQSSSLRGEAESAADLSGETQATSLIAFVIDESRNLTAAQNASSSLPAYEKLMAKVEQNTTRIYELRDTIKETVLPTELSEVNRRIADIERAVQGAIEQNATDEELAQQSLVEVLQRTQKLIVYMTELEVSKTVNIEEIVPVVLTDEEKQSEISRLSEEIKQKRNTISNFENQLTDQSVLEKIKMTQKDLDSLENMMTTNKENLSVFKEYNNKAKVLADDTIMFLEKMSASITTDEVITEDESGTTTDEMVLDDEKSTTTAAYIEPEF